MITYNKKIIYRKIFIIFLSLTLVGFLSMMVFNYYVDGGTSFFHARTFEEKLTESELKNISVLVCTNYNDRSYKRRMLEKIKARPEVLLLGSSRVMLLNQHLFGQQHFFNASVSGAGLEDDIALYYIYQQRGWKPKTVVIGLDHWVLDKNYATKKWRTTFLSEYYSAIKVFFGQENTSARICTQLQGWFSEITTLLSASYFTESLKKISWIHQRMTQPLPENDIVYNPGSHALHDFPICYLELPDGSKSTSWSGESLTASQTDAIAKKDLREVIWPRQLDVKYQKMLDDFVYYLIAQQVEVIFYLPPYEPVAYAAFQREEAYKTVIAAEQYYLNLADKYHLKVIGSYDPAQSGLDSSDFIDYMHLKRKGVKKVFHTLNKPVTARLQTM
jgi:hypothetical protein